MNIVLEGLMVALVENNISFSFDRAQRGVPKGITVRFGNTWSNYFFTPTEEGDGLYATNRTYRNGYIYSFEDVLKLAFEYWVSSEDSDVLEEWGDLFREREWVKEVTVLRPK